MPTLRESRLESNRSKMSRRAKKRRADRTDVIEPSAKDLESLLSYFSPRQLAFNAALLSYVEPSETARDKIHREFVEEAQSLVDVPTTRAELAKRLQAMFDVHAKRLGRTAKRERRTVGYIRRGGKTMPIRKYIVSEGAVHLVKDDLGEGQGGAGGR